MQTVQLAGAFEDIGDHLFGIGTGWAEAGLKLALLLLIVIRVCQRFSVKAGIGAVLGYVLILGIYNSQTDLSNAFKDEITSVGSAAPAVVKVDDRGEPVLGPAATASHGGPGGEVS
ncbi:hypothetical protein ACIBK8_28575 [Streptomyces sp. NPDC050161]|uniref:hypothetical protein n=1 Tax=Streptomyces sp. NPDC050161 TaxID=3365604 RepID=UPI00379810FB